MSTNSNDTVHPSNSKDGISIHAFRGDGMVLLGLDLDSEPDDKFAGFAIKRKLPSGKEAYLLNRLSFTQKYTKGTTPKQRKWTPSNEAPFQKFMWIDVPPDPEKGAYNYEVSAMFQNGNNKLKQGPKVSVDIEVIHDEDKFFEVGFTRGYASSQAYADKFGNKDVRPKKTLVYNYKSYEPQYVWLGYNAREMVFRVLSECLNDTSLTLDVFAYDFDEPEIIAELGKLGKRLRIVLDDSKSHIGKSALEPQAKKKMILSAGADNVTTGHFQRFAHDKVFIMKKGGKAVKVLTGSANFSIRGLYVQANNVIIINDQNVADTYEKVFEAVFQGFKAKEKKKGTKWSFKDLPLAKQWFEFTENDPALNGAADSFKFDVSFAPHADANVSLEKVKDAISKAQESIFYAIMAVAGGGDVLKAIRNLSKGDDNKVFTFGISQTSGGINLYKPGRKDGIFTTFSFLNSKVPEPFRKEWFGGQGQVIHHKFVVIDFKSANPVVFTGSSNLASGGETSNGDNMLAIYDSRIASAYGIEAVRLADHYNFRTVMKKATKSNPLTLQTGKWFANYFDKSSIKYRERMLFK
jgi:phosphatidylserine/phosphatidylglycerophosphate/cardiolipin synthase-like enzyme